MARPSKLTDAQWAAIEARFLAGESARAIAREFDVSEAAIRKRFGSQQSISSQSSQVRTVAEKLADAQIALAALPKHQQPAAITLADELRSISGHLAAAARYGSATAHRLQALAHGEVQKIDDVDPLQPESVEVLKGISALTRLANDAAATGLNLLNANAKANSSTDSAGETTDRAELMRRRRAERISSNG